MADNLRDKLDLSKRLVNPNKAKKWEEITGKPAPVQSGANSSWQRAFFPPASAVAPVESEEPSLLQRLGLTAKGAGQQYAGSSLNALSTMKDFGIFNNAWTEEQGLNETAEQIQKSAIERRLKTEQDAGATQRLTSSLSAIANKPSTEAILKAPDPIRNAGDSLIARGGESTASAKDGASWLGKLGIDVGTGAIQLAADIGIGALTGGGALLPMALRSFGGAAQEAEDSGASINQQVGYGGLSAGTSVLVERLFSAGNVLKGAFGKGVADDVLEKGLNNAVAKLVKNPKVAGYLSTALAGFGGEGIEEFAESMINPVLQKITFDPNANYTVDTVTDALYDGLIGGIIGAVAGGLGGSVDIARGGMAAKNAMLSPQAQDVVQTPSAVAPVPQDIAPAIPKAENMSVQPTVAENVQQVAPEVVAPQPVKQPTEPSMAQASESSLTQERVELEKLVVELQALPRTPSLDAEITEHINRIIEIYEAQSTQAQPEAVAPQPIQQPKEKKAYTEENHIDNRSDEYAAKRSVNAFQYDNPELHPHFADAALALADSVERQVVNDKMRPMAKAGSKRSSLYGNRYKASGHVKQLMDMGLSKPRIMECCQDIINDRGTENYADAKRVEIVLNDMLSNGYAGAGGEYVKASQDYLEAKRAIEGAKTQADVDAEMNDWLNAVEGEVELKPSTATPSAPTSAQKVEFANLPTAQQSAKGVAEPVSESMAMEQKLNSLREERDSVLDFLDAPFLENPDADIRQAENRLVKLDAEIDKLVAEERRASVKTPLKTILENIGKYRRSDLESLAEQIGDGNWDGYEDLTRPELEDALREVITERMDEMSVLEAQHPKNGLSVRPVDAVTAPTTPTIIPENSLGAKLTQQLPEGTGAMSNPFVPEQKVSKVFTNTYQKTDSITDEQRAQMKPEDYQYDVRGHAQNETAAQQRVDVDYDGEVADLNAKQEWTGEDVFTSKKILDKISADAEKSGDFAEFNKWTKAIQERGTRGAKTVEAFKAFQKTPEGAVIKAQQVIAEAEKKLTKKKELGKDVDNSTGRKIRAEKEQTEKAITDEANKVARSINTSDVAVEWWVRDTSIKLSEKIAKNAEDIGASKKAETTMQTMLKDLVRITSGAAPQGNTAKTRSTAATDSLRNYWANPEQYEAAVQRAQRYINERYASDPESLAVFNDWLSGSGINTWQLIGKALQENGVKFNEILMSSWQDKAQLLNKVTERILADTDLTQEESAKAAQYISDKFYDELAQRAQKKVEQLLKPTNHKQQKTMTQRINEFINSGVFSDESIAELVKVKYGIPTLTSADVQKIYELNKLAQEASNDYQKRVYLNRSARIIADKLPATGKQRVLAVRRIAMLLNPKTLISRNAGGNVVFGILENVKDAPGTLVDMIVSQNTGRRTTSYNPLSTAKAELSGIKKGLSEWGKDVKNNVDTSPTEHEMPRTPSFKGAVGRGFEEALNKLLQLGDRPFYEAAKAKRLDELKRLGLDYTNEDAIAQADVYALEKVFQNNSEFAKGAMQLRESLNRIGGVLGDITIPFAQTPANIFDKLADYSPYGFVRAIKKAGTVKDSAWSQKQFVDTLSRSLTGTGILAFAYFAAQAGLISGGEDREEDEGLSYQKKISGWQPYSIVIGDKTYTYDWMTVGGAMLSLGADIAQSENAGDTMLAILSAGAKAGINTMFNQSYLEGISELFSGGDDIASGLESVLLGLPASFTPTAFQQVAKIIDPIARDTYDTDPLKRSWNKVKAKLPFASKSLPAKIGADGKELTNFQGSTASNIFESVLSPGYIGENQKTAIDAEIQRLFKATEKSSVLPKWSKYTTKGDIGIFIGGEKLSMSTSEWEQYQKTRGKQTYNLLGELTSSSYYKSMSDAQKVEAVDSTIDYAAEVAKSEYANANGIEYDSSTYAKVQELQSAGISPAKYFEYQGALKKERPEGGTPAQHQYSKAINALDLSTEYKSKLWEIQKGGESDKNPFTGALAQKNMSPEDTIKIMEEYSKVEKEMEDYVNQGPGLGKSTVQAAYFLDWLSRQGYTQAEVNKIYEVFDVWGGYRVEKPSVAAKQYVKDNPR